MTDRPSKAVEPLLVDTGRGFFIQYEGLALNSRYDPRLMAERSASTFVGSPGELIVVPSPLFFYGCDTLLSRLGPDSLLVCCEADPLLAALSASRLPDSLARDDRFTFLGGERAMDDFRRRATRLGRIRRARSFPLSRGGELRPAAYGRFMDGLAQGILASWRNRATSISMGRLWIRNLIDNLALLGALPSASLAPSPKPIVVCGAGPSLQGSLAVMKRRRDEIFVLSADTAAGTLASAGIIPDLVLCLEAQAHNLKDFTALGKSSADFLIDASACPSTFRLCAGRIFSCLSRFADISFLDRIEALGLGIEPVPPLGSVGVLAVQAAMAIAGSGIALSGLDFSYPAGKTHAAGSPQELSENMRETRLYKRDSAYKASYRDGRIPLKGGLSSDRVLASYADLMRSLCSGSPGIIDARGGGLALGIPAMGMDDAIDALANASYPGHPEGVHWPSNPLDSVEDRAMRVRLFLESERETLASLRRSLASGDGPGIKNMIADHEELFFFFPDRERVAELRQDALNRLAVETDYLIARIGRSLSIGFDMPL